MEPWIALDPWRALKTGTSLEPWRKAMKSGNAELPRHLQTWLAAKIEEERVMELLKQGFTFSYENTKKDAFKAVDQWNKRHPHNLCKYNSYPIGGYNFSQVYQMFRESSLREPRRTLESLGQPRRAMKCNLGVTCNEQCSPTLQR